MHVLLGNSILLCKVVASVVRFVLIHHHCGFVLIRQLCEGHGNCVNGLGLGDAISQTSKCFLTKTLQ